MKESEEFDKIVSECEEIFFRKNAEYGNTIVETGVLGASVELVGCVARLKKLVIQSGDGGKTALNGVLTNIFIDAINYGVIGLMMLRRGNFTGVTNEDR